MGRIVRNIENVVTSIGWDPDNTIEEVLNSDAPNNWSPAGLEPGVLLVIDGNGSSVKINSIDSSNFEDGEAFWTLSDKGGSAIIEYENNGSGSASNRIRPYAKQHRGAHTRLTWSSKTNRWSVLVIEP